MKITGTGHVISGTVPPGFEFITVKDGKAYFWKVATGYQFSIECIEVEGVRFVCVTQNREDDKMDISDEAKESLAWSLERKDRPETGSVLEAYREYKRRKLGRQEGAAQGGSSSALRTGDVGDKDAGGDSGNPISID